MTIKFFRKHSRDLYKIQSEQNNTEIAKKNRELMEKLQQMDILKAKYEEAITNVEPIKATTKVINFFFKILITFRQ